MSDRGPRVSRAEIVLLVALGAWGLFPLVLLLVHAAALHARFTGADGLIGADGVLGADQLQYLAWTRDASAHGGNPLAFDQNTAGPQISPLGIHGDDGGIVDEESAHQVIMLIASQKSNSRRELPHTSIL